MSNHRASAGLTSVEPGWIVILNGAPRSGKSSIVAALQASTDRVWMNLGVDVFAEHVTPPALRPGIGLRPGSGERPDVERFIPRLYAALYDSVAAHSRHGFHVVVDVGHHNHYGVPIRAPLLDAAERLAGLPGLLVGVRCPLAVVLDRRAAEHSDRAGRYERAGADGAGPRPVVRWQAVVHGPGIYDLEVDTSRSTPEECAAAIDDRIDRGPAPQALARLVELEREQAGGSPSPH